MKRTKSSSRWLQEHFNDPYVKKAQAEGYRSRAVYKLKEVDEKEHLIQPGMTIVDLGAAPGGWSQYAANILKGKGTIIALDRLAIEPITNVTMLIGDFSDEKVYQELQQLIPKTGVDLVLSDIAPNMSGTAAVDMPKAMMLIELALDFATQVLKPGGQLFMKIFHGEGFDVIVKQVRTQFAKVSIKKPSASRSRSRETYLLAKGFRK